MHTETAKAPEATTFEQSYRGTADQVRRVRADLALIATECPVADALVLLASELATNAILHSNSGHPDRTFTVRATLYVGEYAWVEVVDRGGPWTNDEFDDQHGRGLSIVAAIAGDDNWGIEGNAASRVVWFRLDWAKDESADERNREQVRLLGRPEMARHVRERPLNVT